MKRLALLLFTVMIVGCCAMAERELFAELRKLGIDISDAAEEYVRSEMDAYKDYGFVSRGEMDDYMAALSLLGLGDCRDTASVTPLTDSVYAFDMEMAWIDQGYEDVLDAVARLSGGAVEILNVSIAIDDETAEAGRGSFPIAFEMNGEACVYTARLETDWMDPGFLDFLNEKLKAAGDGRHLWFATDNGQGLVMFYRDKDWIDRFSAATGIAFFDSMTAEMSIDPLAFLRDWLS